MPNAAPWTPEEDVYLCHANTNASEDGDTSTDQSSALFWDCISDAFAQQAGSEILKSTENELENANNFEDDISEDDAFDADDVLLSPSPICKDTSTNSRPRSGGKKKMKQLFGRAS
ncbi:hypothetical protein L915_07913 [Phytophthora nicotianae]|uniref:Uncharacterized protein n=1 Tax=Phytophthora nicotianae TaxID=4792 RepID=W2GZE4_PHYNI|nr:hypothetical protein L915_07913 [Phytophthora nicotianae]